MTDYKMASLIVVQSAVIWRLGLTYVCVELDLSQNRSFLAPKAHPTFSYFRSWRITFILLQL